MNFSSSLMSGMNLSLGGLEIATDFLYGNSDLYEPDLTEIKHTISNKPIRDIIKTNKKLVKPKLSREAIINKFSLVKEEKDKTKIGDDTIISGETSEELITDYEDDFDFSFDDIEPQKTENDEAITNQQDSTEETEDILMATEDSSNEDLMLSAFSLMQSLKGASISNLNEADDTDDDIDIAIDEDDIYADEFDEEPEEIDEDTAADDDDSIDIFDDTEESESLTTENERDTMDSIENPIIVDNDTDEELLAASRLDNSDDEDEEEDEFDIEDGEFDIEDDEIEIEDEDSFDIDNIEEAEEEDEFDIGENEIDIDNEDEINILDEDDIDIEEDEDDSINIDDIDSLDIEEEDEEDNAEDNEEDELDSIDNIQIDDEDIIDIDDDDEEPVVKPVENMAKPVKTQVEAQKQVPNSNNIKQKPTEDNEKEKLRKELAYYKNIIKNEKVKQTADKATIEQLQKRLASLEKSMLKISKGKANKSASGLKRDSLNNNNKDIVRKQKAPIKISEPEVEIEDPYAKYTYMAVDSLFNVVKKFMVEHGVNNKLIDVSLLNNKFGSENVKRLIKKSYIISIGKGVTIGR